MSTFCSVLFPHTIEARLDGAGTEKQNKIKAMTQKAHYGPPKNAINKIEMHWMIQGAQSNST